MAEIVNVTVPPPQPVTLNLAAAPPPPVGVTTAAASQPAVIAVTQAPQPAEIDVTPPAAQPVTVTVATSPAGGPGPPGANAQTVVLTLAAYLALDAPTQMNGTWYVIPK